MAGVRLARNEDLLWVPQPRQEALIACPIEDAFFGGARGGGKTDGLLGDNLNHALEFGGDSYGILFRKTYKQFEEIVRRALSIYVPLGWKWQSSSSQFVDTKTKACIKLRHLERLIDAENYQGHSYSWIGGDELTNWPTSEVIDRIGATLRWAKSHVIKRKRFTGNPGGVGHNWVKARYISPAPGMTPHPYEVKNLDGSVALRWRVYIPSRLDDNYELMRTDPDYWQRVSESTTSEALLKAWRDGNWDIVAGGMFDDVWVKDTHEIEPFQIPASWFVSRSFDWGESKPFSVGWWAESDGSNAPNGRSYPRGTLFRVAEWYGWKKDRPNEGLKLTGKQIAQGIVERQKVLVESGLLKGHKVRPSGGDVPNDIAGYSIAQDMAKEGIRWEEPNKDRISGWDRMRRMMLASSKRPMEDAAFFVFNTCRQFIRTVPVLVRDEKNPDDVDSDAEDHVGDEARYRVMHKRRTATVGNVKGY